MGKELLIPDKLQEAINKNKLIIFIGAGCSIPIGFPTWKTLVEGILAHLDDQYGETASINFKNVLTAVKSGKKTLIDALDKIENDTDHGPSYRAKAKEYVYNYFEKISTSIPTESKIHDLIWKISSKIITTNYDKALEKYHPISISAKEFDNTNPFLTRLSQSDDFQFLYKIHGNYENPDSIVLFKSDYLKIYQEGNFNANALSSFFKDKTLLFIGFSLSDPFINDWFAYIKKVYNNYTINEHYILTKDNEDFINYDVKAICIQDWSESLIGYLKVLEKLKIHQKQLSKKDMVEGADYNLSDKDISNVIEILNLKIAELTKSPSNRELAKEVRTLEQKVRNHLSEKIDFLQEVSKPFRNDDLQNLFDIIYTSEKLDKEIVTRIYNVRQDINVYKWYDRSVILSAITCSLIHFNKPDEKKISLIIDFINDNEDKVWQKAVTCLFISLNHLGNKWLRFSSIKEKIKAFSENNRVQNACILLVRVYTVGLDNVSLFNEKLFSNEYFKNPFNYFFPFHQDENPAFEQIYDKYDGDNIDGYIKSLINSPLPDQLKYIICGNPLTNTKQNDDESKTKRISIKQILKINSAFAPYSLHVQELINFYKFYPLLNHQEKLKSQLKITETPLKDFLLNEKNKRISLGSFYMQEKNWTQAIVNFKAALKLDQYNIFTALSLAKCYHYSKDAINELIERLKILDKDPGNEENLYALFDLYIDEKDYFKALDISNQLIIINEANSNYHNMKGVALKNVKQYEDALTSYNTAIQLDSKEVMFYSNRGEVHSLERRFNEALSDLTTAIELNPEDDKLYFHRADMLYTFNKFDEAIEDLTFALTINNSEKDYLVTLAANYMCVGRLNNALIEIKKAEALGGKMHAVYNAYANYYRLIGDFDKAFEYLENAEKLIKHVRFNGTRAAIYASMDNDEDFFRYIEIAFSQGAEATSLLYDIKEKYSTSTSFKNLLHKYNQNI